MKLRTGDPWMSGADYGRSLTGFSVNLLVKQIAPAVRFAKEVIGATVIYSDADFAAVQAGDTQWMLHADHCYDKHPMSGLVVEHTPRGRGIELRLHGMDPDAVQAIAERDGYRVLAAAADKAHGVREVYVLDDDGYVWVFDAPLKPPVATAPSA